MAQDHNPTEMEKKMTKSDVVMDAYNFPKDGHDKHAFKGGKRVYSDPKKGNYHDTVYPRDGPWRQPTADRRQPKFP